MHGTAQQISCFIKNGIGFAIQVAWHVYTLVNIGIQLLVKTKKNTRVWLLFIMQGDDPVILFAQLCIGTDSELAVAHFELAGGQFPELINPHFILDKGFDSTCLNKFKFVGQPFAMRLELMDKVPE